MNIDYTRGIVIGFLIIGIVGLFAAFIGLIKTMKQDVERRNNPTISYHITCYHDNGEIITDVKAHSATVRGGLIEWSIDGESTYSTAPCIVRSI